MEGSGEEPYLGSAMAAARVRGFQGARLSDSAFAARHREALRGLWRIGGWTRLRDRGDAASARFWSTYLPPFRAAIDAGVGIRHAGVQRGERIAAARERVDVA